MGCAPGGEEQVGAIDDCLARALLGDVHAIRRRRRLDALDDARSRGCSMPSARKLLEHDLGSSGSSLPARAGLDHGDAAAEAAMRLRQLQPVRPAAEDDEVVELLVIVENRLVGEVGNALEARDGGITGEEPVAMTKRRALMRLSPARTVSRLMNRAAAGITRTPRPVKRSTESFGAMAAITPWMCRARPCSVIDLGLLGTMPKAPAVRISVRPLRRRDERLGGTQP